MVYMAIYEFTLGPIVIFCLVETLDPKPAGVAVSVYWFFNSLVCFSVSFVVSQSTWFIVGTLQAAFCIIVSSLTPGGCVVRLLPEGDLRDDALRCA